MGTTLLDSHLEQIAACSASIAELEFVEPRMFTNALLAPHDITSLIRDTEVHERALFSIAPLPAASSTPSGFGTLPERRRTTVAAPYTARTTKRNTVVAAVLGRDLFRKVRVADGEAVTSQSGNYGEAPSRARAKGEVDVDILLEGATKLCATYPIPGAADEISALRARYQQLSANISHYEDRVERNARQLESMSRMGPNHGEHDDVDDTAGHGVTQSSAMTKADLESDEREIRELERKKKGLESRVSEMEKDLGGLMR